MFKVLFVYLSFVSCLFAGTSIEVTDRDEKKVIETSHTVFEAIYVDLKSRYLFNGQEVSLKEGISLNSKKPNSKFIFNREITLLVTKVIKGELKKHQIYRINVNDRALGNLVKIWQYGNIYSKQVYYSSGLNGKNDFRYRTLRDSVRFETMSKTHQLIGKLGLRIGKIVQITGRLPKVDKDNTFDVSSDRFKISKVDGNWLRLELDLKLGSKYVENDGKLPELGEEVTLEGYESIIVHSFTDEEKMNKQERVEPNLHGKRILQTVFVVTKLVKYQEPAK